VQEVYEALLLHISADHVFRNVSVGSPCYQRLARCVDNPRDRRYPGKPSNRPRANVVPIIAKLRSEADDACRYERILDRIRLLSKEQQTLAMKMLQWMTCSTRAMTLRELEVAVGIQPGDLTVDKRHRPLPARLRSVCGPLVEIIGEDTIVFVHFSAKELVTNAGASQLQ
jgi:hypothetical protein